MAHDWCDCGRNNCQRCNPKPSDASRLRDLEDTIRDQLEARFGFVDDTEGGNQVNSPSGMIFSAVAELERLGREVAKLQVVVDALPKCECDRHATRSAIQAYTVAGEPTLSALYACDECDRISRPATPELPYADALRALEKQQ